jgi:uncharacterized protein (TIGR03435 family)
MDRRSRKAKAIRTGLDRPIVDKTKLPGRYDFALMWTPDEALSGGHGGEPPPRDKEAAPDLFTAFQQQLELKLEATKASIEVLVADHVEKPSGN